MATPHVSGIVALVKAQDPSRDWRRIKNLVLAGSQPAGSWQMTITERRANAASALSCNNSAVRARMRPRKESDLIIASGDNIKLSALNINCGNPAGNVSVTVASDGATVTLLDNGLGPDQVAGDGSHSANW